MQNTLRTEAVGGVHSLHSLYIMQITHYTLYIMLLKASLFECKHLIIKDTNF